MGLFQDYLSAQPELKRLAALVVDPAQLPLITAQQWPQAIIVCGLCCAPRPEQHEHMLQAYRHFAQEVELPQRVACLQQLTQFLLQRQGTCWQALLPFALAEPQPELARLAAQNILLLAPLENGTTVEYRFTGVNTLAQLLGTERHQSQTALLDALLGLADMRFTYLLPQLATMPAEVLRKHLDQLQGAPNRLSLDWLTHLAAAQPQLGEAITLYLERCLPKTQEIIDVIYPLPCWAFTNASPQPLHGWELPEYLPRIFPLLLPALNESQQVRVKTAFTS